jgi:hypothetical protein
VLQRTFLLRQSRLARQIRAEFVGQRRHLRYVPYLVRLFLEHAPLTPHVTDCCDGSDEWLSKSTDELVQLPNKAINCPNTCAAEAEARASLLVSYAHVTLCSFH